MMNLRVLLPFGVFRNEQNVERIVVETGQGSFGLLPHRQDCVAAIVPGILLYQGQADEEVYIAVDAGVLIKTGLEVSISVRHAVAGTDLAQLRETIEHEFIQQNAQDKKVHSVLQKMESDFIHRLVTFHHVT
jgi:F-type H+-transporting ATPase subunit epsilon